MKTQAWGWLAAGVLAAGLNANYHDGSMDWAHRIADRVEDRSAAVLDRLSEGADQLLARAQMVTSRDEAASFRLTTALARVQTKIAHSETSFSRVEVLSDREEAQLARIEANRDRIEAQVARIRIPAAAFNPVVVQMSRISLCPRVRMNIPRPPMVRMPAMPVLHIDAGAGPI